MFVRQRMVVDVFGPPVENLVCWESHLPVSELGRQIGPCSREGRR